MIQEPQWFAPQAARVMPVLRVVSEARLGVAGSINSTRSHSRYHDDTARSVTLSHRNLPVKTRPWSSLDATASATSGSWSSTTTSNTTANGLFTAILFIILRLLPTVLLLHVALPASAILPSTRSSEWPVLQALKSSWGDFSGSNTWLPDAACSTLEGVTCNSTASGGGERITAISLPSKQLSGSIPAAIGVLSHLTLLDLSDNTLTGSIPASIGNLNRLVALRLGGNQLSKFIPASLTHLLLLTDLDVGNNMLSGGIPPGITRLSRLVHLQLQNNGLSGAVPSAVFISTNLQTLDLASNTLSGSIPSSASLPHLTRLSLKLNGLSGTFPSSLLTISSLRSLDIFVNSFEGSFPEAISNMKKLSILNMFANQWSGSIPNSIGAIQDLQYFCTIGNTNMSGTLPESIGNLTALTGIAIGSSPIGGPIPPSFGSLINLQYMQLVFSQINGTIPSELGSLTSLTKLVLTGNQLSGSIPNSLSNLADLYYISLGPNNLSGTIPSYFSTFSQMTFLSFRSNPSLFGNLPSWPATMTNLKFLTFDGCSLHGPVPPIYSIMTQMQDLSLQDLSLSEPFPSFFSTFTNLDSLTLGGNNWTGADTSLFPQAPNLLNLQFNDGNLTGQLPTGPFTTLFNLNVTHNHLTGTISDSYLLGMTTLITVDFSYNSFSGSMPSALGALKNLYALSLLGNNFSGPMPATLGSLPGLAVLNFSNPCPPINTSCVVNQTATSAFCLACPQFCATCTKALPSPPAPNPPPPILGEPPPPPPTPPSSSSGAGSSGGGGGLAAGTIAGIVIGCVASSLLLLVLAVWLLGRLRLSGAEGGSRRTTGSTFSLSSALKEFRLSDLAAATNQWHEDNLLGKGGFGDVYKATGLASVGNKPCAVKRAHTMLGGGMDREIKAMAALKHPNLVRLLGVCSDNNPTTGMKEQILIYELVTGGDLRTFLDGQGNRQTQSPITAITLVQILVGIGRGLEYLHKYNFIHRDVKPANVLLTSNMEAKLCDFGLVREAHSESAAASSVVLGACMYMDPVYATTRKATAASDIYSFGILILVCLFSPQFIAEGSTSSEPGDDVSCVSLLEKVESGISSGSDLGALRNPRITFSDDSCVADLARLALQMCAADPLQRSSIVEVLKALISKHSTLIPHTEILGDTYVEANIPSDAHEV